MSVCCSNLHVTSVTELDNPFPMEKSVLVSAPCVTVVFLELDVRDWFVAWSPVQSVTLVDSHLRKRWTVKEKLGMDRILGDRHERVMMFGWVSWRHVFE